MLKKETHYFVDYENIKDKKTLENKLKQLSTGDFIWIAFTYKDQEKINTLKQEIESLEKPPKIFTQLVPQHKESVDTRLIVWFLDNFYLHPKTRDFRYLFISNEVNSKFSLFIIC